MRTWSNEASVCVHCQRDRGRYAGPAAVTGPEVPLYLATGCHSEAHWRAALQALHTQQPMETGQAYANAQPGSSCSMHSSGGADQWMQAGGGLPQGFGLRAAAAKRRSGNASEMSQYSTYETLSPPITETAVPHYPTVSPPQSGPAAAPACLDPRIELANHLSEYELREISEWYPAVYYVGQHAQKGARDASGPNFGFDTEDTHYRIVPGDHIAYRYEIVGLLGTGTFAQVLKCYDHKRDRLVAVKVIRNELRFHRQAATECRILECLAENVRPRPSLTPCLSLAASRSRPCARCCAAATLFRRAADRTARLAVSSPVPSLGARARTCLPHVTTCSWCQCGHACMSHRQGITHGARRPTAASPQRCFNALIVPVRTASHGATGLRCA